MKKIPITYLSSYLYCPLKFYIEEVLKIKKIDQKTTIKGIIKHKIYEDIAKNEKTLIISLKSTQDLEQIEQKYKLFSHSYIRKVLIQNKEGLENAQISPLKILNELKELFEFDAKNRAQIIHDIAIKKKCDGEQLWINLVPKIDAEKNLESEKYGLKGRVDRIEIHDDKIVPVEFKNSKSSTLFDSQKIQIGAYIILCNEQFNSNSKYGYVHFLKDNIKKLVVINDFLIDEIIEIRKKIINVLDEKNIKLINLKISSKKCDICNYKDTCQKLKEQS